MTDSTILPGQRAALVDRNGTTTPEFYRFFRGLSVTAELPARVDDLTVRVTALEEGHGTIGNVVGEMSIISAGILSNGLVTVRLDGDVETAPAMSYYGALTAGVKGWQTYSANFSALDNGDGTSSLDLVDLADSGAGSLLAITRDGKGRITGTRSAAITGTAGRVTVANGDASAGLPTIDLATVADGGGGALLRFVRDAWGRITGTSAASTDDLTEGSRLYFTAARVLATVLTGLSLATSAVIAATDTVLGALGKLQAQITENLLPAGYIDGLQMQWVSGTALTVTNGAAYIQGSSKVLRAPSAIAKTGLVLTASTWYHVYLYNNSGTPDVEVVTTAPASPYNGTARSKTGDTSRRYVGSVRTLAAGGMAAFDMLPGGLLLYVGAGASAFRVLSSGVATTITDIDVSAWAPPTARLGYFRFQVNGGTYAYVMPGGSTTTDQADLVAAMGASVGLGVGQCRFGNGQKIAYKANDASTPTFIWANGYYLER